MARGAAASVGSSSVGQTVTIINNSGKIVNTGKQLVSLFREVSSTYKDKKAELKLRRFLERSAADEPRTRDVEPRGYDGQSVASSRRSHRSQHREQPRRRHGLTEDNIDRLSEMSGAAASRAQRGTTYERSIAPTECTQAASEGIRLQGLLLQQRTTGPIEEDDEEGSSSSSDDDDRHLAYGSLPPDLARGVAVGGSDATEEVQQAQSLVHRIEDLLDEVECMEHTASEMIKHLQERPEAAAAVALTLAELSAFVGKLSPGFLGVLKGGSPAVFALLASPQFLIGTGIAVGVTVVMFGGWKIVQRAQGAAEPRRALALEAGPTPGPDEEALELRRTEEELSTIESWRRGIVASGPEEVETAAREGDDARSHRSGRTHRSGASSGSGSGHRPGRGPHHREEHYHHRQQHQHHPHQHQHAQRPHHQGRSRRGGDDGASVASSGGASRRSGSSRKTGGHAEGKSRSGKEEPPKAKEKTSMLRKIFKSKDKETAS